MLVYNTLTRKKEELRPIRKGHIGLYTCGPTVYWFAHIGNLRAYLFADILHRALKFNGLKVKFIMNITDVGHLTDDADAGEDKMLVAMRREGKTAYDIAEFYTQAFYRDLERLNIEPADKFTKATGHIKEQVAMIRKIEKNGFAYRTNDGVYFDTSRLKKYGRLSGQRGDEKKAGARIAMGEKKHPTDFALWKFAPSGVKREMVWDSPWGPGFPGWHIECSAMSTKYLGIPFDIHTGGVDHIAVHHENELAQTEGAEGKLQANVWMHSEFLTVGGGKMSKSLGNLYTIQDVVEKGYDPLAFRFLALGAHYRSPINFTWESLAGAEKGLVNFRNAVSEIAKEPRRAGSPKKVAILKKEFGDAINDDLNTSRALATAWEVIKSEGLSGTQKKVLLVAFDKVLGLNLKELAARHTAVVIPLHVERLAKERELCRRNKQFAQADALRNEIHALGYEVDDTPQGPLVKPLPFHAPHATSNKDSSAGS